MKYLLVWFVIIISIDAQFDSFRTLLTNLANPQIIINAFVNLSHFPEQLTEIFAQQNNGTIPQWMIENANNHTSLVSQQTPDLCTSTLLPTWCTYDFIVIGAGTAGSIIASRLTENSSISVLLLEAGGPENIVTDTPLLMPYLLYSPLDWAFITVPQNNCFINTANRQVPVPRGKVMGGSSAINAMYYIRGVPRDYDNWAAITGDNSWNYANVLQYFLKSEHNYDPEFCLDTKYHNCHGLFPVTNNWQSPAARKAIEAAAEFNINQIDLNRPQKKYFGCNGAQQNILNGSRISVSKAFLESIEPNRTNLNIIAFAFVKKIIFNNNKKAIGVQYDRSGVPYTIYTRKEIILSAGVIKSPHILLTSGVGPKQQLQNFNIPVIADLPGVGQNLHDHVCSLGSNYTVPSNISGPFPTSMNSFILYLLLREGPVAHLTDVISMISSSINNDTEWPDIQLNNVAIETTIMLSGCNYRPLSRGNLYLQSNDPYVYPLIQPKYLSHPDDIKVVIDATRWSYRFQYTKTYKNWTATISPVLTVGCEAVYSLVNDTLYPDMLVPNDAYLECQTRHTTSSIFNLVGTCKMGNTSDPLAVVDTQLRVLGGITGLRVIDSSIMPVVTDGNTNAPTMMIAEKGAQMIKSYHKI